jgi:hypothetical protein
MLPGQSHLYCQVHRPTPVSTALGVLPLRLLPLPRAGQIVLSIAQVAAHLLGQRPFPARCRRSRSTSGTNPHPMKPPRSLTQKGRTLPPMSSQISGARDALARRQPIIDALQMALDAYRPGPHFDRWPVKGRRPLLKRRCPCPPPGRDVTRAGHRRGMAGCFRTGWRRVAVRGAASARRGRAAAQLERARGGAGTRSGRWCCAARRWPIWPGRRGRRGRVGAGRSCVRSLRFRGCRHW